MKFTIAQQSYHIGNPSLNVQKMRQAVEVAIQEGSELIIFGELSVSGYGHYDDIFYPSFMENVEETLSRIATLSTEIAIVCGAPKRREDKNGKRFTNVAYVFEGGKQTHCVEKTLLPYFDIFEEEKYYQEANTNQCTIDIKGKNVLFSVCADMWAYQVPNLYASNPIKHIASKCKADFIINISASPFHYGRLEERKSVLADITKDIGVPMIYCNIVGAYDETIFDGESLVFDKNGKCVVAMKSMQEDIQTVNISSLPPALHDMTDSIPVAHKESIVSFLTHPVYIQRIKRALQFSLRSFLEQSRTERVIVASSGGIDSALCLALISTIFPKEKIISLTMPSRFNSLATQGDATQLAKDLGIPHFVMPIEEMFAKVTQLTQGALHKELQPLAKENMQSRLRAVLAMTVANTENALLINTSNKSELSTGYGTMYGDMTGAISPLGDMFKTQVFALSHLLREEGIPIPLSIIEREPSAELSDGQKDSDSLPPYEVLDSILYFFIHKNMDTKRLIAMGFDRTDVEKTISLFRKSKFKRKQFCPIIRISDKAFGQGKKHLVSSEFAF